MKTKPYHHKLCITPEQEKSLPQIGPHLQHILGELDENMPHDIWYYLATCTEPAVRKVIAIRDKISNPKFIPIEAYCAAAEVDPNLLLAAFMQSVDRLTSYSASIRMSSSKKVVTEALINSATIPGSEGSTDRITFLKATGILPQPKGAQTLIQVTQNSSSSAPAMIVAPSSEKTIRRLSDRMNQMQLPPPAEDAVEAEYEE